MKVGDKEKGEDAQILISKELDRKNISVTHKIVCDPALSLSLSLKSDRQGYHSTFTLAHKSNLWKSSLSLCPETPKVDFSLSRKFSAATAEIGLSQTAAEVCLSRGFLAIGGIYTSTGASPMIKLTKSLGNHKISLACGYNSTRIAYFLSYSKGQTRISIPFRVPFETWEDFTLSIFLLASTYLLSGLLQSAPERKPKAKVPEIFIFLAVSGQSAEVIKGLGKDIGPVLRLLTQEKVTEIAVNRLISQGLTEESAEIRVDYMVNGLDYCGLFVRGDVIRFESPNSSQEIPKSSA